MTQRSPRPRGQAENVLFPSKIPIPYTSATGSVKPLEAFRPLPAPRGAGQRGRVGSLTTGLTVHTGSVKDPQSKGNATQ